MALAPDPADKALDAQADGAFGGKTNRRAGYSKTVTINGEELTELEWLIRRAKRDHTLASGEGRKIVEHYEAALSDMAEECDNWRRQADEYHRIWTMEVLEARKLRNILAALREPSEVVIRAAQQKWDGDYCHMGDAISAAVAAAEQEVVDDT